MKVGTLKRHVLSPGGKIREGIEPEILRTNMKVTDSYVERINNGTKQNGMLFEVDEKATEEFETEIEIQREERKEKDSKKKELLDSLGESKPRKRRTKKSEQKED